MTSNPNRTVLSLQLQPIVGSRFQPTGFPDLGAATFERANSTGEQLLVESVQSMSNHFEATTWDAAIDAPATEVAALPYVRVVDEGGEFLTSSRLDAHRLASAYVLSGILNGEHLLNVLQTRFGLVKGRPLDMGQVAREVFALDPVSLLHGVFFAQGSWAWQPKIARAVTAFIEASDVHPAVSGGVKRDSVINTSKDAAEGQTSKEGYGMVPHHRTEYTAARIDLHVVIDEQQLRSYGLSKPATELLSALAQWELATLLDGGLRLRTACDLVVSGTDAVPSIEDARSRLAAAIDAARPELSPVTEVVWTPKTAGKAKVASAEAE